MNDKPNCELCGRKIMGKPTILTVNNEKKPFCSDAAGCRRMAVEARK